MMVTFVEGEVMLALGVVFTRGVDGYGDVGADGVGYARRICHLEYDGEDADGVKGHAPGVLCRRTRRRAAEGPEVPVRRRSTGGVASEFNRIPLVNLNVSDGEIIVAVKP